MHNYLYIYIYRERERERAEFSLKQGGIAADFSLKSFQTEASNPRKSRGSHRGRDSWPKYDFWTNGPFCTWGGWREMGGEKVVIHTDAAGALKLVLRPS